MYFSGRLFFLGMWMEERREFSRSMLKSERSSRTNWSRLSLPAQPRNTRRQHVQINQNMRYHQHARTGR